MTLTDDALSAALRAVTAIDVVSDGLAVRAHWAGDASMYWLVPKVVVIPRHVEDVRMVLAVAAAHAVPVCFRAGGTSLSGQAVTDGILIVISRHLRRITVLDDGARVTCEPGAVGAWVNAALAPHGRRIGPDPASMQAAEIGGIVANNASGMCCGVRDNSYRTVTGLDLILADGFRVDTAAPDADARLLSERPALHAGLLELAKNLHAQPALATRVQTAFATKNTVGYSLNALLDANTPAQILQKLVIGSEGTLAFIASATFRTVPLPKYRATAWLLFRDVDAAGRAVAPLAALGVAAAELLDAVALRRVAAALPDPLPLGEPAALLVEFQTADPFALAELIAAATPVLASFSLATKAQFTTDATLQARYWHIRKGLFPSVGAIRAAGTTVIIEDVTFPVAQLAEGVHALRTCFAAHGYDDAVIFGHAKDGNLHFTLTPDLAQPAEVARYRAFMAALVEVVLSRGGHLKAEHGTGRNMAPFVVRQWGADAVALMRGIKTLLDPQNLLNPGVLLSDDPEIHLKHLKKLPPADALVDRCIECGFCEPICPSRDATLSPRQRITGLRLMAAGGELGSAVRAQWTHAGLDTCAADGLCATACPVHINTGDVVKAERAARQPAIAKWLAQLAERNFSTVTALTRGGLRLAQTLDIRRLPGRVVPLPRAAAALPKHWPSADADAPTVLYLPSCLARMFGDDALPQAFARLCAAAGVGVIVPENAEALCCGQPFASKGFTRAHHAAARRTAVAATTARRIAIAATTTTTAAACRVTLVTDTSTCAAAYDDIAESLNDDAGLADAWRALPRQDPATFAATVLLPRLRARGRLRVAIATDVQTTALHPTCADHKHGWVSAMAAAVAATGARAFTPAAAGCCGMAGDRGWLEPSLTAAAMTREAAEIQAFSATHAHAQGVTTGPTCGLAVGAASGVPYRHLFTWLDARLTDEVGPLPPPIA